MRLLVATDLVESSTTNLLRAKDTFVMIHSKCRICPLQGPEYTELMLKNQDKYVPFFQRTSVELTLPELSS